MMPYPPFRIGLRMFCCALGLAAMLAIPVLAGEAQQSPAAPVTRESLAGVYDGGQMEVGAQLELKPDGRFQYELAYGAMDESAAGTWELKDGGVFLTTVPAVKSPEFVLVSDTPEPRGGLWIKISNGPLDQGARQRVYLLYGPNDEPGMVEIADDGHVPFPEGRRPSAVVLEIPVYPIRPKPIALTGAGGHRLVVRFAANDIGKADFRGMRLALDDGALVMTRRDLGLQLRFKKQPKA